jgi:glycyl-tRNA synthetase
LVAEKKLSEPKTVNVCEIVPNRGSIGKTFRQEAKLILDALAALEENEVDVLEKNLNEKGEHELKTNSQAYKITKDMLTVKRDQKTVHVECFVPSVIEPSFGIGRIMYAAFEHNFKTRDGDEQRRYFTLPPIVAPLKCSILPLSGNAEFAPFVKQLCNNL